MTSLAQDLRDSLRSGRRRPFLTGIVVLTLALGVSATATVFSVIDSVLLSPLPFRDPQQLVVIRAALPGQNRAIAQLSGPELVEVLERTRAVKAGGAIWVRPAVLNGDATSATEVDAGWISPGFLETFGVTPLLGRLPSAQEHATGQVMVLGYELWQQRFGADPSVIGRRIDLDDEPRTVIGVMPGGFRMYFPPEDGVPATVAAWLPWGGDLRQLARGFRVFTVVARLDGPAARPALQAELSSIAAGLTRESNEYARAGFDLAAESLTDALVAPVRPMLLALLGVVLIVFVVACANVANLLLIRCTQRSTEFAVRLALGVGKWRLWRQLVVESALMGLAGGAIGIWLAIEALTLLRYLNPSEIPRVGDVAVGIRTVLVAGAASIVAALFLGSLAAHYALNSAHRAALHGATRGVTRLTLANRVLVVGQLTLAVILLCATGLLTRSALKLRDINPGFDTAGVLSVRVSLPDARYPYSTAGPAIAEFYRQLDDQLRNVPGVIAAGATLNPPLSEVPVRPKPYAYHLSDGDVEWGALTADYRTVTPGWFAAVRARLVSGRFLDERDRWEGAIAVVVDTRLAQSSWPGQEAVGQPIQVELFRAGAFQPHWGQVVGVIQSVRLTSLVSPGREQVYVAHHQSPQRTMYPTIRASVEPITLAPLISEVVNTLEPGVPASDARTASDYVARSTAQTRFALHGIGLFAAVATLLSAAGVFAALSAAVDQRRREIGVRLALGASPAAMFRSTMARGMIPAIPGIGLGLLGATVLTGAIETLLFGVTPTDLSTFGIVAVSLITVAALASWVPAMRAARVNPVELLHSD